MAELQDINPDEGLEAYEAVAARVEMAFIKLDAYLRSTAIDCGGTTCTSVLLTPGHIFFVNVGDSRTILNRGGKLHFYTKDHKPFNAKERTRIRAAGQSLGSTFPATFRAPVVPLFTYTQVYGTAHTHWACTTGAMRYVASQCSVWLLWRAVCLRLTHVLCVVYWLLCWCFGRGLCHERAC